MKELEDYLHLYLGCDVLLFNGVVNKVVAKVKAASINDEILLSTALEMKAKLILRTTRSITAKEWDNAPRSSVHIGVDGIFYTPSCLAYLLSLHVDLFGLIEAGLAIDSTTLK